MKVGIVTVTHQSEYRPEGLNLVKNFIHSLKYITYDYECIVIDNASVSDLQLQNVTTLRIEDQTIYGLTGAWEIGLSQAIKSNCDIIIINNDDLEYNISVNNFINGINNHPYNRISVYGPLSNGILSGVQFSNTANGKIIELTNNTSNMVNGFMFGFTKEFYHTFKKSNGCLFNKEQYPWGGNEEEFQKRIWLSGGRSFVLGNCWIEHKKIRGWKQFNKVV